MGTEMGNSTDWHDLARSWPDSKYWTCTYRMRLAVLRRLRECARGHQVGISDLVNYLLLCALDQVEAGTLEIPTKTQELRRIEY